MSAGATIAGSRPASDGRLPFTAAVELPSDSKPQLFVVVDTEEEFDWSAPFSRTNTGVSAMARIGRVQHIFDRFGIKPTYVVDHPVVVVTGRKRTAA